MPKQIRQPHRTRSFGGCRTCRRRHVKCDQRRPSCGVCERLRLDCEGYESLIQWTQPLGLSSSFLADDSAPRDCEDSRQCRRLLFSDAERKAMCVELAQGITVDYKTLALNMEEKCLSGEGSATEGPYTMFRLDPLYRSAQHEVQLNTSPDQDSDSLFEVQPSNFAPDSHPFEDSSLNPVSISSPTSRMATNRSRSASRSNDFETIPEIQEEELTSISFLFPSENYDAMLDQFQDISTMCERDQSAVDFTQFSFLSPTPQSLDLFDTSSTPISPEGHLLLSHFMNDFVKVASPTPNHKSPWQTLYFPEALRTVGQLTLRTEPSSASLSLLYSLMVISAFHLDRLSGAENGSGYWWKIAQSYQAKAIAHIHTSLRHEVVGPKKAKYKVLLMALLAMVTACVTNGKLVDARKHLLDAQRLIHVRGLSKVNPSRKVQMLHTMFLYLRMMEEATFVYPLSSESQLFKNVAAAPSSARYPSLAGHEWFGTQEDGIPANFQELDEFFENSGPEIRPMFSRIYGIPESLIVLMSHITYLCCEVRQIKAHAHPNQNLTEDFTKRCKVIEDLLCSWTNEDKLQTSYTQGGNTTASDHGAQAFHSSLIIYFYREVRDINRFTLQHFVKKTKAHLLAMEGEKVAQNIASASVLWPGFIAAVEAQDQEDFLEVCNWMRGCADRYGLRSFDRAADVAADIWWARQQENQVLKWPERMLQKKSFMILP